jgi:hypothetical protein
MKHSLAILTAGLATVIAAPLVMCTPHPAHYRVELDIYVADEAALCKRAWDVALERFGPGVAETVTMVGGKLDPQRCLATLIQTSVPAPLVSAGIEVTRR